MANDEWAGFEDPKKDEQVIPDTPETEIQTENKQQQEETEEWAGFEELDKPEMPVEEQRDHPQIEPEKIEEIEVK